ncbi:MAG: hypothetical protein A3F68_03505 [Acidobacteria bacterium RIFCSPLOWO2_12_FULL_54_10]|nr:MAG: hypothetical protein A3F68_03505 [Acidobacteria bacterium RIFCSPLOWO2_12_FULL_54_10]
MNQKLLLIGLSLLVFAAVIVQFSKKPSETIVAPGDQPAEAEVPSIRGTVVADFEIEDVNGAKIRRADLVGKVLLVNFWATWCAPCLIEIPWFIEFQEKYGPQGLQVIGVSLDDDDIDKVKTYMQEHKMNYIVAMGDEKMTETFSGVIGLPTTFIVDRDGKFYSQHRGLVSKEIIETELKQLLNAPQASLQRQFSLPEQSESALLLAASAPF